MPLNLKQNYCIHDLNYRCLHHHNALFKFTAYLRMNIRSLKCIVFGNVLKAPGSTVKSFQKISLYNQFHMNWFYKDCYIVVSLS